MKPPLQMDVMVDLETLGVKNNAIILVIAAIKFDRREPPISLDKADTFYKRIEIKSCEEVGLVSDEETVAWWNTQDKLIREEAMGKERIPLKQALQEFNTWFGNSNRLWCQGPHFDIAILSEAYTRCGLKPVWKFWKVRDTRTAYDLADVNLNSIASDNKHHALYDCQRQIDGLKLSLRKLAN